MEFFVKNVFTKVFNYNLANDCHVLGINLSENKRKLLQNI